MLYLYSSDNFELITSPLKIEGRIWGIDFSKMPSDAPAASTPKSSSTSTYIISQLAVASGADMAIVFDNQLQPWLQVHRPRTARAIRFHPNLPIIAIGDGSGFVSIVDIEREETLKELHLGSRVNTGMTECRSAE